MRRIAASLARIALATGAVVGTALGGAAVVHAINAPDQTAMVHGCYAKNGGQLRIVDSGVSCDPQKEVALDWLRAGRDGPLGPDGPDGPPGDTGPAGPAGPPGADGRPLAPQPVFASASGSGRQTATAGCPAGTRAVSGGWSSSVRGLTSVTESGPSENAAGWRVTASHSGRWTLVASALCTAAQGAPSSR